MCDIMKIRANLFLAAGSLLIIDSKKSFIQIIQSFTGPIGHYNKPLKDLLPHIKAK